MNFCVDFSENPKRFSAQFHEDDQSFEGFGKDLQLVHGKDGKSAYEVAVENGFEGTEEEWLESIKGNPGGYYSPKVTQTATDTVQFAFNPSAPGMPAIEPAEIKLPVSGGGGGVSEETDPTVPDWAKQPEKPKYTAEEVGGVTPEEVDEKISTAIANIPNPSWDDLEDKPFGDDAVGWDLVGSATKEFTATPATGVYDGNVFLSNPVVEGKKYKLIAKNIAAHGDNLTGEYVCTLNLLGGIIKQYLIGSRDDEIYAMGLSTGQDFSVYAKSNDTVVVSSTWRFEIYEEATVIYPLDEKFIPDTIARTADIPSVDEIVEEVLEKMPEGGGGGVTSWNDLTDKPFGVGATELEQIASASSTGSYNSVTTISIINLTLSVELGRKYRIVFRDIGADVPKIESTVIATQVAGPMGQYISLGTNEDDIYGYQLMAGMPWTFNFKNPITFPIGYDFILYEAVETLTTLDEKFIPDTIARVEDIPTVIDDALRQAKESGEFDGKDGISPIVDVTDITGGHRVTITDVNGEQTFDVMDGKDGEGGGGGGAAIIDVTELPTENINEDVFYRLLTGTFVFNRYLQNGWTCFCVDGLPAVGEPALQGELGSDTSVVTAYYNMGDSGVYGYVDDTLSYVFGVPVGWYPAEVLFGAAGLPYGGIITDIMDDPADSVIRLLLEYAVYCYKDGWKNFESVAIPGEGYSSVVLSPGAKATGEYSTAFGWGTAEGNASFAGGEGWAPGYFAFSFGTGCTALGEYSFAQGLGMSALSDHQFVYGCYGTKDREGKYLHIVGNGASGSESNAHTLDWNGLGWFAGGLKVGGTGQDDPTAVSVLTTADMATITQSVIDALPIYNGEVESV